MSETGGQQAVRLLLLEDSRLDAELCISRLEKSGLRLEVFSADGRASYFAQLHAREYDLILADYALPDFDGLAALDAARALYPFLPFVFISGRVGEEVAIESLQRGATDYVLKQRLDRLVPAVNRALKEAAEHASRMRVEQQFRDSEMRFCHVIDALPEMVWIATEGGELSYTNTSWRANVPVDVKTWLDPLLIHEKDRPACISLWEHSVATHETFSFECRMSSREDRGYRWHLIRMVPLLDSRTEDGRACANWLGTATDLQEQKLNEEALRTAETLAVTGRMLASIAHEINNPLESLTNLVFLARLEAQGNPRAMAYLDMTENELARISAITKQTLQFYRDPATPTEVDAKGILDDVLRLFSTRMATKNIHLNVKVEGTIVFKANKGEMRQVLINLVGNAIDAVRRGGEIEVLAGQVVQDGRDMVQLEVRDNGVGLAENKMHRLFQPFFSTKGAHGTGLGLWVSKGIVEKHGGTIKLISRGIEGQTSTTATVLLPRDMDDPGGVPAIEGGEARSGRFNENALGK